MEFLINRTSTYNEKPCNDATKKRFIFIDRRTVKTLAEARQSLWGEEYFSGGTNHREENGMVARDLEPIEQWTISINTLEDLIKFISKQGPIIISEETSCKGVTHEIEIYDEYRE